MHSLLCMPKRLLVSHLGQLGVCKNHSWDDHIISISFACATEDELHWETFSLNGWKRIKLHVRPNLFLRIEYYANDRYVCVGVSLGEKLFLLLKL